MTLTRRSSIPLLTRAVIAAFRGEPKGWDRNELSQHWINRRTRKRISDYEIANGTWMLTDDGPDGYHFWEKRVDSGIDEG